MYRTVVEVSADEVLNMDKQRQHDYEEATIDVVEVTSVSLKLPRQADEGTVFCENCGAELEEQPLPQQQPIWRDLDGQADCPVAAFDAHVPTGVETQPLGWANSAGIRIDEARDEVVLWISTGDPRGAFTFTVRRSKTDGRVYLMVPHPNDPLPHEEIEHVHRGVLKVKG